MFGESDSESPRAGSPWDSLLTSSSPSPPLSSTTGELELRKRLGERLPKLAPEVEYGNIEYKLQLLNPSPERFRRLVTQLKWRLLEGGGQAYYELGVADSGQLIGLTREDLERSLDTLEMMAGDIGASVIIVKEIEVPGREGAVRRRYGSAISLRTPDLEFTTPEPETSTTETETEDEADDEATNGLEIPLDIASEAFLDFEIEIASVYKPLPPRFRPSQTQIQSKYTKRGTPPNKIKGKPIMKPKGIKRPKNYPRGSTHPQISAPIPEPIIPLLSNLTLDDPNTNTSLETGAITVYEPKLVAPIVNPQPLVDPPRLIVEALVVRKLALEEAFLDFGGFAPE